MSGNAAPLSPEAWVQPAGLAPDGVRWLSLREVAAGAAEAPWAELAEGDRARLLAARADCLGEPPPGWRSAAEVEWLALGFQRHAALGRDGAAPPIPPPLPPESAAVLLGDGRWDPFARAAGQWRRERLEARLPQALRIPGDRLSRQTLYGALAAAPGKARLLSLSGHGRAERFFGDAFETLLSADPQRPRLPGTLHGWTVHLLACRCARRLGPALLAAGAAGFVGYAADFLYDPDTPEPYFAADGEVVLALAAGLGAAGAVAHARAHAEVAAWRLRRQGEFHRAAVLAFNAGHLQGQSSEKGIRGLEPGVTHFSERGGGGNRTRE